MSRAHGFPTPHRSGQRRLSEPPWQPTIRCSVHAPRRLYYVEHTRVCSSQSDRGPPPSSQEGRAILEVHLGTAPHVGGGATTTSNSPASLMRTGQMTIDNASHAPVTCLPWAEAPSATSQSSKHVSRCPRMKLSIILRHTPPRRAYTSANSWGRSSTSPSTVQIPSGKTTIARVHNLRTHWLVRRPSTST
jgi:hypothetical protein